VLPVVSATGFLMGERQRSANGRAFYRAAYLCMAFNWPAITGLAFYLAAFCCGGVLLWWRFAVVAFCWLKRYLLMHGLKILQLASFRSRFKRGECPRKRQAVLVLPSSHVGGHTFVKSASSRAGNARSQRLTKLSWHAAIS